MYPPQGYGYQNIYSNGNYGYGQNYQQPYPNRNKPSGYPHSNPAYPQYKNPNANSNTNSAYNNNNQSIPLEQALTQSSYPKNRQEIIKDMLICEYCGNQEAKVYFQYMTQEKLFVVLYRLPILLGEKIYNIEIYMYIPKSYPDTSPEFYIAKNKGTCINKEFVVTKIINEQTFQINVECVSKFNKTKSNINEIINDLKNAFNQTFPVFKDKNLKTHETFGKNFLNKNTLKLIIIKADNFNDNQLLYFMRNRVKNIVHDKYYSYNKKYKPQKYYESLRHMKMGLDSGSNSVKNPMNKQMESLKKIKGELSKIENGIKADIQNIKNSNRTALTKCDDLIKIKNEKDLEFIIKRKILEDYLIFLKKGYEKNLVSLEEMLKQTRMLTREIFSIDYLRQKMKYS